MQRSVAETDAVVKALGLDRFDLFGNSWGGMLAQQYMLDAAPSGAASLTISNSIASIPEFAKMVARLKSGLDPATQAAIDRHEAAGSTHAPDLLAAIRNLDKDLPCAGYALGPESSRTRSGTWAPRYSKPCSAPSDFNIVGTIRDWDVVERLNEIAVPTMVLAGRYDECVPERMWEMHQRIAGSRFELSSNRAGRHPVHEEPDKFDAVMREFLHTLTTPEIYIIHDLSSSWPR